MVNFTPLFILLEIKTVVLSQCAERIKTKKGSTMAIKSATIRDIRGGKIKRLTIGEAKAAVAKMSRKKIAALEKEDVDYEASFKSADRTVRGAVIGRPRKEIKREVVAVRIPADVLVRLKSMGSGWSTRAGDALAQWVAKETR
jgi:uncharacterized protein (DUF4415 family)